MFNKIKQVYSIQTISAFFVLSLGVAACGGEEGTDGGNIIPVAPTVTIPPSGDSINSTSQNSQLREKVSEQPFVGNQDFKLFGANDLGMHCGDFDTRISSILPPFNILHAQVIKRGKNPQIMMPSDGVSVVYSASSSAKDPVLTGVSSSGEGAVLSSVAKDGTVFKTNFWEIAPNAMESTALSAYRAFYPPNILDNFIPQPGQGLPVPNVEQLYLGDGALTAEQQSMSGIANPYSDNTPQSFKTFTGDQPFFTNFNFGYIAKAVNWFEAAGVPMTAFDDKGRENPWPLMRLQAHDQTGKVLASSDIVVPISGEANCGACHNAPVDGGNGSATKALEEANIELATTLDDLKFDVSVPLAVSKEYAADLNLVRLHDLKHNTNLEQNTPVVCQSCHYSPALDLAHVGPKGEGDSDANGRQQTNVRSMSNVMHKHHASVKGLDGKLLFPTMPPAIDKSGKKRNALAAREILNNTCYQCHPGRRTDCLRGAMATAGLLCQDCHGQMAQVGDDFSRHVSPTNAGKFELAGNFYKDKNQPRVPWANEPSCGSCHSGDAMSNLNAQADTLASPDGIRLMQAYRIGDKKATPIIPTNKRFAENVTKSSDPSGAGNPILYRLSKGHKGVFCEACHGSTHGIWPNKNPNANDNVTALELQGHTGTITECTTCHGENRLGNTLEGPHGMHPVGRTSFANGGHSRVTGRGDACRTCHGNNGQGTVLSRTAKARDFTGYDRGGKVPKGHQVSCTDCHGNRINGDDD